MTPTRRRPGGAAAARSPASSIPNEIEIHWSILIVVYPYITGLVAGAFILASLVKVFNVKEVQPTYRLSLLTALAFLLVAPLPLLLHLGRPERFYEILLTPNLTSAMAMFGFVYAWYLMGVLLLEIWFEFRRDLVRARPADARAAAMGVSRAVAVLDRHQRRRRWPSTARRSGPSPSSASRRRSCSTATSGSSSDR